MTSLQIAAPLTADEAREVLGATAPLVESSPTQSRLRSADDLVRTFGDGRRRPEWTWVARHPVEGPLAAVAALGVTPGHPTVLDLVGTMPGVAPDDPVVSVLTQHATREFRALGGTEACIFAPPGATAASIRTNPHSEALESAGWRLLVERLHYEFPAPSTLGQGVPLDLRVERLTDAGDPRLLGLFRQVIAGSLDAHDQAVVQQIGADAAARKGLRDLLTADPIECLHLASDPAGTPVGLVSVKHSGDGRGVLIYIGVAASHRGHGYGGQLLGWASRWLITSGATVVAADTDVTNLPMARAFDQGGWQATESRLDFTLS